MPQGSFSASVSGWARETKARTEAVYKESVQRVVEVMQTPVGAGGNLPVDTGYLRASLVVRIGATLPAATDKPDGPGAFSYDASSINLVITGADLKDAITAVYTARYARHVHYGTRGHAGRQFVSLAAQQWSSIVSTVCAEAKARAK